MDDISSKISEILSDPQSLEQIKGMANMLGIGGDNPNNREEQAKKEEVVEQKSQGGLGGLDLSMLSGDTMQTIMSIIPLLSEFNKEDDSTRLLSALRPFLSDERRGKLDEAGKILNMLKLMPMLKTLNILG